MSAFAEWFAATLGQFMPAEVAVFIISMIPLIELRGAVPVGVGLQLPIWKVMLIAIVGNMVPIPFIYLFARSVLEWGAKLKFVGGFFRFFLEKGERAGKKLQETAKNGLFIALFLFVGIPLPGTGGWTGIFAASLLDMDFKKSIIAVMCGVILAGVIMLTVSLLGFGAVGAVAG